MQVACDAIDNVNEDLKEEPKDINQNAASEVDRDNFIQTLNLKIKQLEKDNDKLNKKNK